MHCPQEHRRDFLLAHFREQQARAEMTSDRLLRARELRRVRKHVRRVAKRVVAELR